MNRERASLQMLHRALRGGEPVAEPRQIAAVCVRELQASQACQLSMASSADTTVLLERLWAVRGALSPECSMSQAWQVD